MGIRVFSRVSFKIKFDHCRKKTYKKHEGSSAIPMKAIPLAALLAMSPMDTQDVFAIEPNAPRVEQVQGTQQSKFIPMPESFKILKDIHLNHNSGGYIGFKLISTDKNSSNYEIVEITNVSSSGTVLNRGILKTVSFSKPENGKKSVYLDGINLNRANCDDYAPQRGIFTMMYPDSNKMADIFDSLVQNPDNNNAVLEKPLDVPYRTAYHYDYDLEQYKKLLGIY